MSLELYFTGQMLYSVTCDELHAFPFTNSLVLGCERTEAEPVPLPVGSIVCDCSQPSMCCSPVGQMGVYSLILLHALESCLGFPKTSGGCGRSAIVQIVCALIRQRTSHFALSSALMPFLCFFASRIPIWFHSCSLGD